jgi:hypothetical protein
MTESAHLSGKVAPAETDIVHKSLNEDVTKPDDAPKVKNKGSETAKFTYVTVPNIFDASVIPAR